MEYPEKLALAILESCSNEYMEIAPTLKEIDDLATGGYQLKKNADKYLVRRNDETDDIYNKRLERFTSTPVLGSAIAKQVSKLLSGTLIIDGIQDNTYLEEKISNFKEKVDGSKKTESTFLTESLSKALKFKKVYACVDKQYTNFSPLNRAQEKEMGLEPYITLFTPLEVVGCREESGKVKWIKIRQIEQISEPFTKEKTRIRWTFITSNIVLRYSLLVSLSEEGTIKSYWDEKEEEQPYNPDYEVPIELIVEHGLSTSPIVILEVPDELWVGNLAYQKAREHLEIDNQIIDIATSTSYIQRVFVPRDPVEYGDDPTATFSEDEISSIKSSNKHLLVGKDFIFAEMQGFAITNLRERQKQIEQQIQDIVSFGGVSAEKGAVQQSGVSKSMDYTNQETVLKQYGQLLTDYYQDVLQLVSKFYIPEESEISVSGYDEFNLDTLEDTIEVMPKLLAMKEVIAPTTMELYIKKLNNLLNKNISSEKAQAVEFEIEKLMKTLATGEASKTPDRSGTEPK